MNALLNNRDCSPARRRPSKAQLFSGLALLAALAFTTAASAGGIQHKYFMRGQVLEADGNTMTICIGERDGAEVGQVLDVIRHVAKPTAPKAAGANFTREDIGKVRITEVYDEHYAKAEVVAGAPKVNDTVELESK